LAEDDGLGLLFPLESNRIRLVDFFCQDLLGFREGEAMQRSSLGRFVLKKREKRRDVRELGLSWPKFKFEFELFKLEEKVSLR
jgi:hypothetical protein